MKKLFMLAVVSAFAAVPTLAHANADHAGDKFAMMDTDKDGKVTKAEFDAAKDKWFMDADANKDGSLSKEELQAAHDKKK